MKQTVDICRNFFSASASLGKVAVATALGVIVTLFAGDAYAGPTTGTIISNVLESWKNMTNIFSTIAYLAGAYLSVQSILKFKWHVDNPQKTPLGDPIRRMIAGGAFLSLPFMIRMVQGSLFKDADARPEISSFTDADLTPGGMDELIVNFISDVAGPAQALLMTFAFLAATALLLVGIFRITKSVEEGPRGPTGFGTIMTFISAGALFSFGNSMGAFATSLFGDTTLSTNALIANDVINNVDDREKIEKVIEGLLVFVMLVGYIAFMRGWFVLKDFADGKQGATVAQGLTFLFAGTLAINLGELINALGNTVGINTLSFT
jgi:hypothetical protein